MPISLDYAQTRALAKKFRELTGTVIPHTQILSAISSVVGMPMDGMMHMLKSDADLGGKPKNAERKIPEKGGRTLEEIELGLPRVPLLDFEPSLREFKSIRRHPSMPIPDFDYCRKQFLIMLHKGDYSFVMLRIDNLDKLTSAEAESVLLRMSEGLGQYIAENPTLAACTGRGEVAILLEDVDAMDEEDETLGWLSRALPFRREDGQPEVLITAAVTDLMYPKLTNNGDLDDMIDASREAFRTYNRDRPPSRFIWGPTEY
jgi:hypothetical protein